MRAARVVAETALGNALRQHGDMTGAVVEDGEVRFEVKKVVKLGARAYAPGLLQVQWAGWEGHEKESTWQRASDVPQLFMGSGPCDPCGSSNTWCCPGVALRGGAVGGAVWGLARPLGRPRRGRPS